MVHDYVLFCPFMLTFVYSNFAVCCYTQFVHVQSKHLVIQLMEQLFECMYGLYKQTMFATMVMIG